MSILVKPYEISVWDDVWENDGFVEKRLGVIGSNEMIAQCRVMEPNLVRNVNGVKKLTFKMYHQYIDNMTGEKVTNPFASWMISERKVKLHYEDIDYDFIIKNIVEDSSTYLYTYQLEDAIVQELSKNGFGTILDEQKQNNMGSAETLAKFVMGETDWTVESEKFVEKVEEHLVYATITRSALENKNLYKLSDSNDKDMRDKGVSETLMTSADDFFGESEDDKTILAFYSSCKNKPYRFQFIYLNSYARDSVKIDKNSRTIQEKDCQYFIEFWPDDYEEKEDGDGFIMPKGITTLAKTESSDGSSDGTISVWYKGNRYGYAQKAIYSPTLERYINEYKQEDSGDKYYGFIDKEYVSPTLVSNLVSNTQFQNTYGWIGASTSGSSDDKATVENVYGRFVNDKFVSSIDDLKNGVTNKTDEYVAYMRITLPNRNSIVFNEGLYDNRKKICRMDENTGNMGKDTEWAFRIACGKDGDASAPTVSIGEYETDDSGGYKKTGIIDGTFDENKVNGYSIYKVSQGYASSTTFGENSHVRIALTSDDGGTYYIKEMECFRAYYKGEGEDKTLITPNNQSGNLAEGIVNTTYCYFSEDNLNEATSLSDLTDIEKSNQPNKSYLPVFNEGAEKIRSVSVKESNHFNNLQSIAETFECWVDFDITRRADGAIDKKTIKLKNYAGEDNHAYFRYGVNLRDIQRTYESKNITTKLIVKPNNNELGEDGFCTIQRAGANPTGESYIYDFQYYQNVGLMSADQYIDVLYKTKHGNINAVGPDIDDTTVTDSSECNIQGYFPRLRELNRKLINENKLLSGKVVDLREKNTQLKVAQETLSAAKEGVDETAEDFLKLTGFYPWEISEDIIKVRLCSQVVEDGGVFIYPSEWDIFYDTQETAKRNNGIYCEDQENLLWGKIEGKYYGLHIYHNRLTISAVYKTPNIVDKKGVTVFLYPKIYLEGDSIGRTVEVRVDLEFNKDRVFNQKNADEKTDKYSYCEKTKKYVLIAEDNQSVQNYIVQYNTYKQQQDQQSRLVNSLTPQVNTLISQYNTYCENIDRWTNQKARLNKAFYNKYSRFIQEGTWMSEEYVDDDKYYADALSVIYNSCYPQVAYSINVVALNSLPEYEDFTYKLGDKTYAIDPEFFGNELKEEVVITEISSMLDDPSKDIIKVQNFKNQFQDLFQKITATSQQVQYNAGSYERGAAQAEAIAQNSIEFLTQTLDEMTVNLTDPDLESTSVDGSSSLKIVDGKILFGKKKEDGTNEWTTGLSSKGISANKITAGSIDTGVIQIMSGTEPAFRWDAFGISAFGNSEFDSVLSNTDTTKFVRFDKYGLYGIDGGADGLSWHPTGDGYDFDPMKEIDDKATFALTWEGLKVTGDEGVVARIGKDDNHIIKITKKEGDTTRNVFSIGNRGDLNISLSSSQIEGQDNLLIKTSNFEHSSWRGLNYWSKVYDANGSTQTDSLNNEFKKIGFFFVNGMPITLPDGNNRNQRTLYQFVKGKKGVTYTFSFNHKMIKKDLSWLYDEDLNGEYIQAVEPNTEKGYNIAVGGKDSETYQIVLVKQGSTRISYSDIRVDGIIDEKSRFVSTEQEERKVYQYKYDEEDGEYFALGIQYSTNYSTDTNSSYKTEITIGKNTYDYINGNELLISSMKLTTNAYEKEGDPAGNWTYNIEDFSRGMEIGQGNILKNYPKDLIYGNYYPIKNMCFTSMPVNSAPTKEEEEDWDTWNAYSGGQTVLELSKDLLPGNYVIKAKGRAGIGDQSNLTSPTDSTTIVKATAWLMPMYKCWDYDKEKGEYVWQVKYYSENTYPVFIDTPFTTESYAYFTITPEMYADMNTPIGDDDKSKTRLIGWRLGIFLVPKDIHNGDKYIEIDSVSIEKLERTNLNNLTSKGDLALTAEGMVASTYAPSGGGFGWSLTPDGFYLKQYQENDSGTTSKNVFYVDKNGDAVLTGNITWEAGSSPTQVVYAKTALNAPPEGKKYSEFDNSNTSTSNVWHKIFNSVNDKYASYTYDGGNTWGTAVKIVGNDGTDGTDGLNALTCTRPFTNRYEVGETITASSADFNRTPQKNEIFSNVCANIYYTTFKVISVNGTSIRIESISEITSATRDGIANALRTLDTVANDGIYKDGNGNIAINASAIKTGCIMFGTDYYIDPFNVKGENTYVNLPNFSITPSGGNIGGWEINGNKLYSAQIKNETTGTTTTYGTGMASATWSSDPMFWSGYTGYGAHPWDHAKEIRAQNEAAGKTEEQIQAAIEADPWWDHTNFSVDVQGKMRAHSGNIGDWKLVATTWEYTIQNEVKKISTLGMYSEKQLVGYLYPQAHSTYIYSESYITPYGIKSRNGQYQIYDPSNGDSTWKPKPPLEPDSENISWSEYIYIFWHQIALKS